MPLGYWETIPIRPFIAVWPTRAMASATLNAVPDKDGYRLPRMLSITGYVADSPIPTSTMPTAARAKPGRNIRHLPKVTRGPVVADTLDAALEKKNEAE